MNADRGFDAQVLRQQQQCSEKEIEANRVVKERNKEETGEYTYFDDHLYKGRFVIERMNAWIDSFKALLVRFETNSKAWLALHFLACAVILCKKFTLF